MATVERSVEIDAAPNEVWAVLADFGAISAWAPIVDHSALMTRQTEGVGAVRRIQAGRVTIVETVTAWEPGESLAYALAGLPPVLRSVESTWRLSGSGESTTVHLSTEVDVGPRPPQRLVAKAVARRLGRSADKMLAGLRAHLMSKGNVV